jgi:hypothetical protein
MERQPNAAVAANPSEGDVKVILIGVYAVSQAGESAVIVRRLNEENLGQGGERIGSMWMIAL